MDSAGGTQAAVIESVSYTLAAILLYVVSDWLLQRAELAAARRFKHRNVIFFFILLGLSLAAFWIIGMFQVPV